MKSKMKNMLVIGLIGLMSLTNAVAQEATKLTKGEKSAKREAHHAKIKEMKVAFLKQELALTDAESNAFWPIYNNHEAKVEALRKEHKAIREQMKGKSMDDLSEDEAKKMLAAQIEHKEKMLALDKVYQAELLNVLPAKKVLKYFKAEREFKRKLMKKAKQHGKHGRKGRMGGDMPPPPPGEDMPMEEMDH